MRQDSSFRLWNLRSQQQEYILYIFLAGPIEEGRYRIICYVLMYVDLSPLKDQI